MSRSAGRKPKRCLRSTMPPPSAATTDDLLAKAVVHHAASASGLPVPPRTIALSPQTAIESWAPTRAVGVDTEVLEWLASQMRGKRRSNRTLMSLVATIVGAAALPLAQLPRVLDIGV